MTVMISQVKNYRETARITQTELAELVHVRRETIGHLEIGKYNPSLKLAMDIAHVLNAKVEDLFNFVEIPEETLKPLRERDYGVQNKGVLA